MDFDREVKDRIVANKQDRALQETALAFMQASVAPKYSYNYSWMGRPIIQYPQDMVAMQEIIWNVKPNLIIETGIAHGGSLIFYASILELISVCGGGEGEVLGIDVDIREHNRKAIEAHPMAKRISMIQGSSISPDVASQVEQRAQGKKQVLVCLDSNHTHAHVLSELNLYGPLTSVGSYCVVFDTLIEDMEEDAYPDRPWGRGNNPKTAVHQWLQSHQNFSIDESVYNKILITVAPDGYLKRIK